MTVKKLNKDRAYRREKHLQMVTQEFMNLRFELGWGAITNTINIHTSFTPQTPGWLYTSPFPMYSSINSSFTFPGTTTITTDSSSDATNGTNYYTTYVVPTRSGSTS